MSTAQKIIQVGYFWPTLFHDCIHAVKRCDKCHLYANKVRAPPTLLHPVITVGPFCKWGIDFMTCHPPSSNGHKYIVMAVDYFTKWVESMPTFNNIAAVFSSTMSLPPTLSLKLSYTRVFLPNMSNAIPPFPTHFYGPLPF
jgi:hypothetical protein